MNLLLIGTILIGIFLFITWFAKTSSKKISNSIIDKIKYGEFTVDQINQIEENYNKLSSLSYQ